MSKKQNPGTRNHHITLLNGDQYAKDSSLFGCLQQKKC